VKAHEIPELDPQPRDADGHGYVDSLASEKLSVGLAVWPAGSTDRQRPPLEDEVYYVISRRARSAPPVRTAPSRREAWYSSPRT